MRKQDAFGILGIQPWLFYKGREREAMISYKNLEKQGTDWIPQTMIRA